jgi:ADP-ribose pyrophosphatase YjhB (NUDIX family)
MARRVLRSKTKVNVRYLEQVVMVSGPERDPRG